MHGKRRGGTTVWSAQEAVGEAEIRMWKLPFSLHVEKRLNAEEAPYCVDMSTACYL